MTFIRYGTFTSIHMRDCGHVGTDMGKVLDVV